MGLPYIVLTAALALSWVRAVIRTARAPADGLRPPGRWGWLAVLGAGAAPAVYMGLSEGFWPAVAGKSGSIGDIVFGAPDADRIGILDRLVGTYGVRDTPLALILGVGAALVAWGLAGPVDAPLRRRDVRSRLLTAAVVVVGARVLVAIGFSGALRAALILTGAALVGLTVWSVVLAARAPVIVTANRWFWIAVLVAGGVVGLVAAVTVDISGNGWRLWRSLLTVGAAPVVGLGAFHLLATPAPALRDLRVLRIVTQVATALVVLALASYLSGNLLTNLSDKGISTTFDNLGNRTDFVIQDASFSPSQPIREGIVVLVRNTFAVVIVGIPVTLLIGVVIGVARLSTNWLVNRAAALYVEILRNIPPLIVIIFFSQAVLLPLPRITEASEPLGMFVISNVRMAFPSIATTERGDLYGMVLVLGLIAAAVVARWRTRVWERTGADHHRVAWALGVFGAVAVVGWFALGGPWTVSLPRRDGRVITGGIRTLAPYVAVTAGLTLYTASHVAEIIRGSILAVPKGQTEAANALGLSAFQRYRFVILPQAMRIAIPALINQGLNFTKNSSLAIAVGYADITFGIFTMIGNANPAPQLLLILMGVYLGFSLLISVIGNAVNRRLELVS